MLGLELVETDESAAAELARLRGVLQRFPEGSLHLEALEGKCAAHCFSGRAGRLSIKTKVHLQLISNP